MNSSSPSAEIHFVSNCKSGQNIKIFTPNGLILKACQQRIQYYPQTANFNIESRTCQCCLFCCPWDKTSSHQTGNPCEGNPCLGKPIRQIISAKLSQLASTNRADIGNWWIPIGTHRHRLSLVRPMLVINHLADVGCHSPGRCWLFLI